MDPSNSGGTEKPFSRAEILALIAATYRASLPYLILFLAGLLVATWVITEIIL